MAAGTVLCVERRCLIPGRRCSRRRRCLRERLNGQEQSSREEEHRDRRDDRPICPVAAGRPVHPGQERQEDERKCGNDEDTDDLEIPREELEELEEIEEVPLRPRRVARIARVRDLFQTGSHEERQAENRQEDHEHHDRVFEYRVREEGDPLLLGLLVLLFVLVAFFLVHGSLVPLGRCGDSVADHQIEMDRNEQQEQ